jgi:hypothetical protein
MQDHPLFTREALQELSVYLRPTGWQGWVENISNQPENSIIRRMEQLLHDRETIEAGRQYSIRDLPPRWQEIIRRSLAERGFSQHEVDAQVQFRVVLGLQFLLQNGGQRRVMGIRLTETRVFFYTVDGTGQ